MIDPGRLKTRLTIEAPVESADDQGGVVRRYAPQAVIWAAVMPVPGPRPAIATDGAWARFRVTIRSGQPLTLRHRLRDGDKTYSIRALRERDDGRITEIDAELRLG